MALDINRLRRHPPGPRVLVAVDQSTLSELALNHAHVATRELLVSGAEAGKLVCPMSPGATDETLGTSDLWRPISDLHEELSMGIGFLEAKVMRRREAFAAAAAFCNETPVYTIVEEAFDCDPHINRNELCSGGGRDKALAAPDCGWRRGARSSPPHEGASHFGIADFWLRRI